MNDASDGAGRSAGWAAQRAAVPDSVLLRQLEDEAVLLNLDSEQYFGLDPVGTEMLNALTESPTIQDAFERLLETYDVDEATLASDLAALLGELEGQGLVALVAVPPERG